MKMKKKDCLTVCRPFGINCRGGGNKKKERDKEKLFFIWHYVAYSREMVSRKNRAQMAESHLSKYSGNQQDFLKFVLSQYVKSGVEELDDKKLPTLLELKYHTLADGIEKLGDVPSIRNAFIGVQENLYQSRV